MRLAVYGGSWTRRISILFYACHGVNGFYPRLDTYLSLYLRLCNSNCHFNCHVTLLYALPSHGWLVNVDL